jgi:hypothetical protein
MALGGVTPALHIHGAWGTIAGLALYTVCAVVAWLALLLGRTKTFLDRVLICGFVVVATFILIENVVEVLGLV